MKRVFLFLATNLAVVLVLGVVVNLLGLNRWMTQSGIQLGPLLGFAAVFGMGGSLISLAMSKWIAKASTRARVIARPADATEQWLVETVRHQASRAGIAMPEVAIFDSPEPNAFATGPTRSNSLVAVSTGLLRSMSRDAGEAVLAHEVSHVANGDMVTLSLIQGVVNTFVIALARVVGYAVDRALSSRSDEEYHGPGIGFWVATMAAELVLGILASIVVMWFSRKREYQADAGGARLAGRERMIAALERLKSRNQPSQLPAEMAAFGIVGGGGGVLQNLLRSHPPLEERIAALRRAG
ncbi:MAG: protease HtpX [Deferrisomatales bacterium]